MASTPHKIIVVGGGAGGLELVTSLGKSLGRKKQADITLVDSELTHIWKPLLHEIASGSLNSHDDEINYMAHSYWHHYQFRLGRMDKLDREKQEISTAPMLDENGVEYIPRRHFSYDTLVVAVGSQTNHFNIEGVTEHCHFLDDRKDADRFHQHILRSLYTAQTQHQPLQSGQLNIAIAGAGATGIELSAELHQTIKHITRFDLDKINPEQDIKITIIEAAENILPALPKRLSDQVAKQLKKLNIRLITGKRIVRATKDGFYTSDEECIQARIKIWTAGIKAPDFLSNLSGLETNRINQLVVTPILQTTLDKNIFAFGDCAACPLPNRQGTIPPRAQAAHQQASVIYKTILRRLVGKPPLEYRYIDYGSLINMSRYSTVGNLMGNLAGRFNSSVFLEGMMARFMYLSLYKLHQLSIHGPIRVALHSVANLLTRKIKPKIKLH